MNRNKNAAWFWLVAAILLLTCNHVAIGAERDETEESAPPLPVHWSCFRPEFMENVQKAPDYAEQAVPGWPSPARECVASIPGGKVRIRRERLSRIIWIHREKAIDGHLTPEQAVRQLCREVFIKKYGMDDDAVYRKAVEEGMVGMSVLPQVEPNSSAIVCLRRYANDSMDRLIIAIKGSDAIIAMVDCDFVATDGSVPADDLSLHRYPGIEAYLGKKATNVISEKLISDRRFLDLGNAKASFSNFAPVTRSLLNACMWGPEPVARKGFGLCTPFAENWLRQRHCFFVIGRKSAAEASPHVATLKAEAEKRLRKVGNPALVEKLLKAGLAPSRGGIDDGGDRFVAECEQDGSRLIAAVGEFDILFNVLFKKPVTPPPLPMAKPVRGTQLSPEEKNKLAVQALAAKKAGTQFYADCFGMFFRSDVNMPRSPRIAVCEGGFWNLDNHTTGDGLCGAWPNSVLLLLDKDGKWMLARVEDGLPDKWDAAARKKNHWPQDPAYHWFDGPQPSGKAGAVEGGK